MEQNSLIKNSVYVIAALAGAGLIVYGAFFYTKKPSVSNQQAQVLPSTESAQPENSGQLKAEINFVEPFLGEKNAPVTMIEYGSYLCGHCINFGKTTFPKIEADYIKTGKVKFIYRSYPPLELGMAALCANDQNKFWEYHKYAIENQINSEDDLKNFAQAIGLDINQFNQCMTDKKYNEQAQAWYDTGQADGVQGTPTFLINGKALVGEQPYEKFQETIEAAINAK